MDAKACNSKMDWFPILEQCEFTWDIENINSYPRSGENNFLKSPVFAASLKSLSRWYLKLHPNTLDEPKKEVDLHLYRQRKDTGPKKVSVACNISFRSDKRCIFSEKKFDHDFKRGSNFKISLKPFEECLEEIHRGKSKDILTIICDMVIYADQNTQRMEPDWILPPLNPDLQQLSKDLEILFWSENFADAYVQATDGSIKTHKVILAAQSSVFKELLLKDVSEYPTIVFENLPRATAEKILVYLYSGTLKISEQDMPFIFEIRKWANKYQLLHLIQALIPDKIKARSVIEIELCEFNWQVEDLAIPEEGYIQSPFFGVCTRENWFLRLHPRFSEDLHGQIDIEIGVENLSRSVHLQLDITVTNEVKTFKKSIEASPLLDVDKVILLDSSTAEGGSEVGTPNYLTQDDSISLDCSLEICDTRPTVGYIEKYQTCAETSNPLRTSLMELSKNLLRMHQTSHFCDKMLRVEARALRVHRSILCARSPVFASMFQELEDSGGPCGELKIPDLTSGVLLKLIKYVYSGQLPASSFAEAESLYLAADRYCVPVVKFDPPPPPPPPE